MVPIVSLAGTFALALSADLVGAIEATGLKMDCGG